MFSSRAKILCGFGLAWLASIFALLYPIYVIRPFRHQSAAELALALQIMRYRPALEIVCTVFAIFLCIVGWKVLGLALPPASAATCTLMILAFAAASRINVYEQMFHPAEQPTFASVNASKLAAAEEVIAIWVGGAARAYPVRIISYHHIINDTLAGEPVVATY